MKTYQSSPKTRVLLPSKVKLSNTLIKLKVEQSSESSRLKSRMTPAKLSKARLGPFLMKSKKNINGLNIVSPNRVALKKLNEGYKEIVFRQYLPEPQPKLKASNDLAFVDLLKIDNEFAYSNIQQRFDFSYRNQSLSPKLLFKRNFTIPKKTGRDLNYRISYFSAVLKGNIVLCNYFLN